MKRILLMTVSLSLAAADLSEVNTCHDDPASLQLLNFKERNKGCTKCLTTTSGAPVDQRDIHALNGDLMRNTYLVEDYLHIVNREIPQRIVHPKGAGAFGYFQVTHNITKYCKAKMFNKIGKRTPVFVRFSLGNTEKGSPDTTFDVSGFVTKFYTEDGHFDIIGLSTKIFSFKDPIHFSAFAKAVRNNPVTNMKDSNSLWDIIWKRPESLPFFLSLFGTIGYPDGYIHTPGFAVHTYILYNDDGTQYGVRWHKIPKCGVKNLRAEEAVKIASIDPYYSARQIYNAIAEGNYPTYTLGIQVVTKKQIDDEPGFDFFDVTKLWPESKYPVIPVGDIVLNKNPDNFFASVEQVAFCPSNLVPGILGAPDNVFAARTFAYKAAQSYRLGVNFNHIEVNRPRKQEHSYYRDGVAPTGDNGRDGPNYMPNSYNGPVPCKERNKPEMIKIKQFEDSHNFDQIAEIYRGFPQEQRVEMAQNIAASLSTAYKGLQLKILKLLGAVDADLEFRVSVALTSAAETCTTPKKKSEVTVDGKKYMCPFSG